MYTVSILVPVFKAEKCFERCLRSLFEQTYAELEFVFVDDHSPDGSIEVLMSVASEYPERQPHIKLIRSKTNRGVAASRTIALENASGEFICFVDADDWLELNAIEAMVEKQQSERADIIYGKALMHTSDGFSELTEDIYKDKHEMMLCYSRFTGGYTMVLWRRLIRRSLFVDHGIRGIEGLNYAEDKYILTQIGYYSSFVSYLDRIVYHYNRLSEDSLVATASQTAFPLSAHKQEIGNMLAVIDFFQDKSEEFYSESNKALLRFLQACMNEALSASSKEGFLAMVEFINHMSPAFWDEIGWNSWKRVLYRNYYYMKLFPKVKKIVKRVIG